MPIFAARPTSAAISSGCRSPSNPPGPPSSNDTPKLLPVDAVVTGIPAAAATQQRSQLQQRSAVPDLGDRSLVYVADDVVPVGLDVDTARRDLAVAGDVDGVPRPRAQQALR